MLWYFIVVVIMYLVIIGFIFDILNEIHGIKTDVLNVWIKLANENSQLNIKDSSNNGNNPPKDC